MKETITLVICIIAYLVIGFPILKTAFRNIIRGDVFDEHFLMCLASIGAFCVGEYEEAIMVMVLYRIGQYFQLRAVEKSRKSIEELIKSKSAEENADADEALEMAEDATIFRAGTEEYITKFARIYSPIVVICAVLVAIVPSLVTGDWSRWVHSGLTFLVISCPCAMVISVPIAFYGGIGAASANKILFRGSNFLEALSKADENGISEVPKDLCGVNIAKGSDAQNVIEDADLILMDESPEALKKAVQISKKTLAIAKQNIVMALGFKVAVIITTLLGFDFMWLAMLADEGVCIIAIANSLRALNA